MGVRTRTFNTGAGIALATAAGVVAWAVAAFAIFALVSN